MAGKPKGEHAGQSRALRKRRSLLKDIEHALKQASEKRAAYSRQIDYEDLFTDHYESAGGRALLSPPYAPDRMFELYEESGILQSCVEAYVQNVDGFGQTVEPDVGVLGDAAPQDSPTRRLLEDLFEYPNPEYSFTELRKRLRRDLEVTGNAYMEVVRNLKGEPQLLFWVDARRVRLSKLDETTTQVSLTLPRGGETQTVTVHKRFRRMAMVSARGLRPVWFKEFGDPRRIDANSGDLVADGDGAPATELIHFKIGNGTYGIPRWIGTVQSVMGSTKAEFVNYDLFDSQGIPPLIITVAGGSLSEESLDDLRNLLVKAKSVQNFHKVLLLEAESDSGLVDGKGASPKLDVQSLSEHRKEDAMFLKYLEDSRKSVRQYGFRLPSMFVGDAEEYSHETASIVRHVAEEQIFAPERVLFDEIINRRLIPALGITGWKLKTLGPVLKDSTQLLQLLPVLIEQGAFTVNELIAFVNEHFGTQIEPYEDGEAWANIPIPQALQNQEPPTAEDVQAEEQDAEQDDPVAKNARVYKSLREIEGVLAKFAVRKCACGEEHAA